MAVSFVMRAAARPGFRAWNLNSAERWAPRSAEWHGKRYGTNPTVLQRRWSRRQATSVPDQSSTGAKALPVGTIVVTMPKLSPSTRGARVERWLKRPGDSVEPYELLLEVSTSSLTGEGFDTGKFCGRVTLQVECVDHAHLVKVFEEAGAASEPQDEVPVGEVIAVMCEEPDQVDAVRQLAHEELRNAVREQGDECVLMNWHAYLKD
ncbi:Dihydrolipoyllysine-residue acetyltransferase component 2 [Porphyridium purpureum]|uniref:Dihydrolipoyllysine-residue acetyltransferase component 2 n=1 Tax=Porphyridium purpureum TaxID=35688 RepID=A0A5J4Z675_PORPP|nr:Dihydrolipoyllysine-residue acetyltransferase component 2 [Porphyridium purpureum]|eukprot:POR2290..scf295_1